MFTGGSGATQSGLVRASFARAPFRDGRIAVLLNANAKRVTPATKRAFERIIPGEDLFFSRSFDEAEDYAHRIIERRYDLVLTGGGDGTVVHTLNLLLRAQDAAVRGLHRPPLPDIGVLRLGTGNALAHATGAGRPLEDVMRVLAGRAPAARPLMLVEDREAGHVHPFASVGYDAQLLNDYLAVVAKTKSVTGKRLMKTVAGYFYALFTRTVPSELKTPVAELSVTALGRASLVHPETDEELPLEPGSTLFEGKARCVMWGTAPYYGFKMKVLPFAERRSDRFHLRVSTASIPHILGHLPAIWQGRHRGSMFVDFLVEGARIESNRAVPYQVGGDGQGYRDKLEVQLSPRTFRVLDRATAAA